MLVATLEELVDYIKQQQAQSPIETLRNWLVKQGHPPEIVEQAIQASAPTPPPQEPAAPPAPQEPAAPINPADPDAPLAAIAEGTSPGGAPQDAQPPAAQPQVSPNAAGEPEIDKPAAAATAHPSSKNKLLISGAAALLLIGLGAGLFMKSRGPSRQPVKEADASSGDSVSQDIPDTPEGAYAAYLAAVERSDAAGAKKWMAAESLEKIEKSRMPFKMVLKMMSAMSPGEKKILGSTIEGDTATVTAESKYADSAPMGMGKGVMKGNITMVKEDGRWKILKVDWKGGVISQGVRNQEPVRDGAENYTDSWSLKITRRKSETKMEDALKRVSTLHPFRMGKHEIDGNVVEFSVPGNLDTLYLFNLIPWKGPRSGSMQLVVGLYDESESLIEAATSVSVSGEDVAFGSIAFDSDRDSVARIAHFTMVLQPSD